MSHTFSLTYPTQVAIPTTCVLVNIEWQGERKSVTVDATSKKKSLVQLIKPVVVGTQINH